MGGIRMNKEHRGYDWDEVEAKPPEEGCEGCMRYAGLFKDSKGVVYSECLRFYSCLSGDYSVLVPLEHTPCTRFRGRVERCRVKKIGEKSAPLLFGSGRRRKRR